jgi:hypothetical protein
VRLPPHRGCLESHGNRRHTGSEFRGWRTRACVVPAIALPYSDDYRPKSYRDDKTDDAAINAITFRRFWCISEFPESSIECSPSAVTVSSANCQQPVSLRSEREGRFFLGASKRTLGPHPCEESLAIGSAGVTRRDEISLHGLSSVLVDRDRRPFGLSSRSELEHGQACWTISRDHVHGATWNGVR